MRYIEGGTNIKNLLDIPSNGRINLQWLLFHEFKFQKSKKQILTKYFQND